MWKIQFMPWKGEDILTSNHASLVIQTQHFNILCDCPFHWALSFPSSDESSSPELEKLPSDLHLILITCPQGLYGLSYLAHSLDLSSTTILTTSPVLQSSLPYLNTLQELGLQPPIQILTDLHHSTPLPEQLRYHKLFVPTNNRTKAITSNNNIDSEWSNSLKVSHSNTSWEGSINRKSEEHDSHHFHFPIVVNIKTLSFNEIYHFVQHQLGNFTPPILISPHSSGYCIGSCYWSLKMPSGERTIILGPINLNKERYPLTLNLDDITPVDTLCFYDPAVIISDVETPHCSDSTSAVVEDNHVVKSITSQHSEIINKIYEYAKQGISVLIPLDWFFIQFLEIIEELYIHLSEYLTIDRHLPIFCVCPEVKSFFISLDSSSEWLNPIRRDKSLSKAPESGFIINKMIQSNSLIPCDSLEEFGLRKREPCLLFISPIYLTKSITYIQAHDCEGSIFIENWVKTPNHTILIIEDPSFRKIFSSLSTNFVNSHIHNNYKYRKKIKHENHTHNSSPAKIKIESKRDENPQLDCFQLSIQPTLKELLNIILKTKPLRLLLPQSFLSDIQNFVNLRTYPLESHTQLFLLNDSILCPLIPSSPSRIKSIDKTPSMLPPSYRGLLKESQTAQLHLENYEDLEGGKMISHPASVLYAKPLDSLYLRSYPEEGLSLEIPRNQRDESSKLGIPFSKPNIHEFISICKKYGWAVYPETNTSDKSNDCWVFPDMFAKVRITDGVTEIECNYRDNRKMILEVIKSVMSYH